MQLEEDYLKEHYTNPQNNVALEKYNAKGICKNPDNSGEVSMYLLVDFLHNSYISQRTKKW